ncbi:hypothetical protein FH972_022673 [Carpinus fangiana]|uniref:FAD-binding domain-containing protein n=1 Tax=Carpinus fangiana TaxID=176857 RepID=A0A5N6KTB0_9ROSI|nr:hypothetical protein FH972_022673 [Carpinus fangiana]
MEEATVHGEQAECILAVEDGGGLVVHALRNKQHVEARGDIARVQRVQVNGLVEHEVVRENLHAQLGGQRKEGELAGWNPRLRLTRLLDLHVLFGVDEDEANLLVDKAEAFRRWLALCGGEFGFGGRRRNNGAVGREAACSWSWRRVASADDCALVRASECGSMFGDCAADGIADVGADVDVSEGGYESGSSFGGVGVAEEVSWRVISDCAGRRRMKAGRWSKDSVGGDIVGNKVYSKVYNSQTGERGRVKVIRRGWVAVTSGQRRLLDRRFSHRAKEAKRADDEKLGRPTDVAKISERRAEGGSQSQWSRESGAEIWPGRRRQWEEASTSDSGSADSPVRTFVKLARRRDHKAVRWLASHGITAKSEMKDRLAMLMPGICQRPRISQSYITQLLIIEPIPKPQPSSTEMTTPTPKIAIVGGGPSGLTLARILHVHNIPATVYELDKHALERPQGGSLDLHERTGQEALRRAGLFDAFLQRARYDGEDLVVADRHGTRHIEMLGEDTGRPEIDRTVLREILLASLPAGQIQWGKKLARAEVGTLHFADGTSESGFDLIVGADGAWSKVRPLVTTVAPFYTGVSGVDINIAAVDARFPALAKFHGRGSFFIWGEEVGQVLLCQRLGDGSIRGYAFSREREGWSKENDIDWSDLAKAKEGVCEWMPSFAPELLEYVRCADSMTPRPLYQLPVGLEWQNQPGVALMGDAAHLMTPFAGEGVNAAMNDAMHFAEAIVKQPHDLVAAVKEYEAWMFPAAEKVTQKTWKSLMARFKDGGIAETKAMIAAGMQARKEQQKKEAEAQLANGST